MLPLQPPAPTKCAPSACTSHARSQRLKETESPAGMPGFLLPELKDEIVEKICNDYRRNGYVCENECAQDQ